MILQCAIVPWNLTLLIRARSAGSALNRANSARSRNRTRLHSVEIMDVAWISTVTVTEGQKEIVGLPWDDTECLLEPRFISTRLGGVG